MMRLIIKYKFLFFLFLFPCLSVQAQQYNFKNYGTKNEFAGTNITFIFQDSHGFIWFGAEGGVSKFDGKIFKNYTKKDGLVGSDLTCITEDKSGIMWFATSDGVSSYDGVKFKNYTTAEGLCNNSIKNIYIDDKNQIWFASDKGGVSVYDGKKFQKLTTINGLINKGIYAITQDKANNYWFATNKGIGKYDGSLLVTFPTIPVLKKKEFVSLFCDSKGNLWFGGNHESGVIKYDGNKFSNFTLPKDIEGDQIACITEDKKHNIWFATEHGILKYDGIGFTNFSENNGLSANTVYSLCSDNENNLWIGTLGKGADLFNNESFVTYTDKQGLSTNKITSIIKNKEGELLVGTLGFGLNKLDGNSFSPINNIEGLSDANVLYVTQNNKGEYWIGTGSSGVFVLEKKKNKFVLKKHYLKIKNNELNAVVKIIFDNKGNTYLASFGSGFSIINDKEEIQNFATTSGFVTDKVITLFLDSSGNIWLGTYDAGVIKYSNGKFTNYNDQQEQTGKEIWSIAENDNHQLFFGTRENGLLCFDGQKLKSITTKDGLCSDYIEALIWDNIDKCLWAGTERGVNKIKLNSQFSLIEPPRYYSEQEGFKGVEVSQNAMYLDTDGIIWFGTNNGLCSYNRKFDFPKTTPPKVYISEIKLGLQSVDWKKYTDSNNVKNNIPENLILSYKDNHLTFNFQALTTDNVKYKYILEGQDNEWTPLTNYTEASFTNITPGKSYTFKVKAQNSSGVWSANEIAFRFTISPPWWQTWWFYTILILTVFISFYSFVKYRTTRLLKDKKQLEEKVEERTSELKVANTKISQTLKEKEDSIVYAKRIQYSLLAHEDLLKENLIDYFVLFKPKDVVSGDFYWALKKEDSFYLAVCDSTGHGVPGAFMSLLNISFLNEAINEKNIEEPNDVFNYVRNRLIQNTQGGNDGMDATLARVNKGKITYSSAFNKPLIIRDNEVINLPCDRMPVGRGELMKPFTLHSPELKKGDILYLFTDGFVDQFGGETDTKFTPKRLKETLLSIQNQTMEEQMKHLESVFDKWKGNREQTDDILIFGIRIHNV